MPTTYRSALGLDENCIDLAKIKTAWKALATELHPDKPNGSNEKLALINAAFTALKGSPHLYFGRKADLAWARQYDIVFGIKAQEPKPKAEQPKAKAQPNTGPKGDRCGHPTKSGPCWRPAGHPTNHASEQNLRTKAANAKARKAAAK